MAGIREDLTTRAAYVSDASIYRRLPAAVAEPHDVTELRELLALAAERRWPVTCRGGATSVAGNAIGDGLVIDTSRYFNRILSIDPEAMTATIEPGVVCDQLRVAAAEFGLTYGPDPSTHSRATVGGKVPNNACGSHSVAWCTSADNLVAATVMLADGREIELCEGGTSDPIMDRALLAIRDGHLAVLRTELGQFPRQVSGYGLHYLLPENEFDTAKAFAGSEGTCGISTRLTVKLVRRPAHVALAALGFQDVFAAATAAPKLRIPGVYTIDGMGSDLIAALRTRPGRKNAGTELPDGGGWLYCEVGAASLEEAETQARSLLDLVSDTVVDSLIVPDWPLARTLWNIREAGAGIVTRLPDAGEAWPGWEGSAVPPSRLREYLCDLYDLLHELELTGIPFGHFGEGCVHIRISFDFSTNTGVSLYRTFIERAAKLVHQFGGSASGEHGDGRARSELLSTIYTPEVLHAFREFKRVFDPENIFSPGVLVDPEPLDQGIRPGVRTFSLTPVHALSRDGGSFESAINRCVGVGQCRSDFGAMCPSFQARRDEVHSTRGRTRVLSEMLRGETLSDGWKSKEVLEALDLCLSCKACATECPVNVDMATYKAEFLHQRYRHGLLSFVGRNRRPLAHFTMGWMPLLMRCLERVPLSFQTMNFLESFRPVEELTKRLGGIELKRRMISFVDQPLIKWFRQRQQVKRRLGGDSHGRETVVLWPDTFTNFAADEPGKAAVEVLEAMGNRVVLPAGNVCCGLTFHSTGQLDMTRKVLRETLDVMEPLLAAGYPIMGLELSCTVMLTHEITELLPGDPRAERVAKLTTTLGAFAAAHLAKKRPWPFLELSAEDRPTQVVCQVHCHQQSAQGYGPELEVLDKLGVETAVEIGRASCRERVF